MGKRKEEDSTALARLVPSTMVQVDGQEIMVPNGPSENANANRLLASQMRHIMRSQLKKYTEQDVAMTPKELKELAEAARNIAEFSGVVYQASADLDGTQKQVRGEKPADPATDDIDLSSIGPAEVILPEIKDEQPSN